MGVGSATASAAPSASLTSWGQRGRTPRTFIIDVVGKPSLYSFQPWLPSISGRGEYTRDDHDWAAVSLAQGTHLTTS
jgi:hypothetical protein